MSVKKTIARNTLLLSGSQFISSFFMYLLFIIAARLLGVASYGKFIFAVTYISLLRVVMDLGLTELTIRDISNNKDLTESYFVNISIIKAGLTILSFLILYLTLNLTGYAEDVRNMSYILFVAEAMRSYSDFMRAIFRGHQRMEYEAIIWVGERLLLFIVGCFVLYITRDYIFLSWTILGVAILKVAVTYFIVNREFIKKKMSPSLALSKDLLKGGILFGAITAFAVVSFKIDTVMLSFMKGDEAVGIYNAAYQLLEGIMLIQAAFFGALFPMLSSLQSDMPRFESVVRTGIKYNMLFVLPFATGVTIMAEPLVKTLYGNSYVISAVPLKILVWAAVFRMLASTLFPVLSIKTDLLLLLRTGLYGMIINIILNLLLIPQYGYIGASISTVLTELSVFIFYCVGVASLELHIRKDTDIITAILIAAIVGITSFLFSGTNIVFALTSIGVIYLMSLFLLRCISGEDINLIWGGRF